MDEGKKLLSAERSYVEALIINALEKEGYTSTYGHGSGGSDGSGSHSFTIPLKHGWKDRKNVYVELRWY